MEPDIAFSGGSGKECKAFLHSVMKQAHDNDKSRDDDWIADFVGAHLVGDALVWFIRLPKETRQDWDLLAAALLERYLQPERATEPAQQLLESENESNDDEVEDEGNV